MTGGRAFVLCTSIRNMLAFREALARPALAAPAPGRAAQAPAARGLPRRALGALRHRRASGRAWTCPGEALSLVIIDRLPFAPPGDPVVAARMEALAEARGATASPSFRCRRRRWRCARGSAGSSAPAPTAAWWPCSTGGSPPAATAGPSWPRCRRCPLLRSVDEARALVGGAASRAERGRPRMWRADRLEPSPPALRYAAGEAGIGARGMQAGPWSNSTRRAASSRSRSSTTAQRLSGKTTNLQALYQKIDPKVRGRLMTLDTKDDRTLFFDMMPVFFKTAGGREGEAQALHGARPGDARVDPPHRPAGDATRWPSWPTAGSPRPPPRWPTGRTCCSNLEANGLDYRTPAHRHPDEQDATCPTRAATTSFGRPAHAGPSRRWCRRWPSAARGWWRRSARCSRSATASLDRTLGLAKRWQLCRSGVPRPDLRHVDLRGTSCRTEAGPR